MMSDITLTSTQIAIRKCVYAYNGQFKRSEIAKLLIGSQSQRIDNLRTSPFFGQLADQKRKSLMHNLDVLIQQGLLELDAYDRVQLPNE